MREVQQFRRMVWAHYKKHGRHELPWRKTKDLYKILVSEVMLQQTQVERVIPFYKKFIKQFPTAKKLAQAPLSEVLKCWQGLGYNRRAKMLHQAAKEFKKFHNLSYRTKQGVNDIVSELEKLPGVGPYTARAVVAFAWNQNVIFVETNIRTVIIHHFFSRRSDVEDTELVEVLKRVLPKGKARKWYSALMDYGAHLKSSGISHNTKSRHYVKQSKFVGSLRQARGAILRALVSKKSYQGEALLKLLGTKRRAQVQTALAALQAEKLVRKKRKNFVLAD